MVVSQDVFILVGKNCPGFSQDSLSCVLLGQEHVMIQLDNSLFLLASKSLKSSRYIIYAN